jgi:hypothetical protein
MKNSFSSVSPGAPNGPPLGFLREMTPETTLDFYFSINIIALGF